MIYRPLFDLTCAGELAVCGLLLDGLRKQRTPGKPMNCPWSGWGS